jgi:serine phosphatase RsbU (regulator of sigma subunit)
MPKTAADAAPLLEWAVATKTLPGETQSGDLFLVKSLSSGALVAVVDGLGHGGEAAAAARVAVDTIDRQGQESPLALFARCHRALQGTRGVVMSVAVFGHAERSMTWLGVGNVEGLLLPANGAGGGGRARGSLVTRGGIVGSELPRLQPHTLTVEPGDLLIFATDGIREGFADGLRADATPQQLADQILARHGRGTDDALVLVARYRGGSGTRG